MTRTCKHCGETKPIDDFREHKVRGVKYRRGKCRVCEREWQRAWITEYRAAPEGYARCRAAIKKYQQSERGKACQSRYSRSGKGRKARHSYVVGDKGKAASRRASGQQYGTEAYLGWRRRYRQSAKGKAAIARSDHARRVQSAEAVNDLTAAEWQQILAEYKFCCAYCGVKFDEDTPPTRDHVVPVSKGGGLTKENVKPACRSCNSRKHDKVAA